MSEARKNTPVRKKRKKKLYNSIIMNTPMEFTVLFIVLFLVAFGIIMVYSSSFYVKIKPDEMQPYIKQLIFAGLGFFIMYVMSKIQLNVINKFAFLGYLTMSVLLIYVLINVQDVKGSKRWIPIGGINLQPSEVAKFMMIIVLGLLLTKFKKYLSRIQVLILLGILIIIPLGLIASEDLSSAVVLMVICAGMIFVTYKDAIKLAFFGVILGGLGVVFLFLSTYRKGRIQTYLDGPWSDPEGAGRQIIQSLYAIGSGGLTGIGLGQSIQKMGYISEAHNDIIFAIICEELGLLGGIAIIGLYMLLVYRIAQIVFLAKSLNHFLVGIGIMCHIGVQVFVNIGVAIGLVPTTGMPLPFISYGGSSLIIFLAEIGLVLNIARHNKIEEVMGG